MKILNLILKKKWYNLIEQGIKTEEYREIRPYYSKKFLYGCAFCERVECTVQCTMQTIEMSEYYQCKIVKLRLGYTKKYMLFHIEKVIISKGKEEWGANPGQFYFVIKLGKRMEI